MSNATYDAIQRAISTWISKADAERLLAVVAHNEDPLERSGEREGP